jgi:CelD/BcsL family acetyltransferase involved in cellulose biosynthesis
MRDAQVSRDLTLAQNLEGRRTLAGVSWVATINQNIRINEGSHAEVPYRRRKAPRASSRDFRG